MRLLIASLFFLLVAGCGGGEEASAPPKEELSAPDTGDEVLADAGPPAYTPELGDVTEAGPYRVGYRKDSLVYVPEGSGEEREIGVAIWYPTEDTSGEGAAYVVQRPDVLNDATVLDATGLPVVIFSHGSSGYPEQSFFWTEFLASHGFVVAAPEHVGNTFGMRTIPFSTLPNRPQDVVATLDFLYADEVLGPLLSDDVVVGGHSFGGYTAFALVGAEFDIERMDGNCDRVPGLDFCDEFDAPTQALFDRGFRDERFKLAVPMAPFGAFLIYGDGASAVDVPVMLVTGSVDRTLPNLYEGDRYWSSLDGPDDLRIDIEGAGHFTFANVCELPVEIGLDDGCGASNIDPPLAHRIINAYSLAFIRHHLWGDESNRELLEGTSTLADEVGFSVR